MAHERIEINPEIMAGKPVIRGTRVPVELILRKLGAGMSAAAILADHPKLTRGDIRFCRRSGDALSVTASESAGR